LEGVVETGAQEHFYLETQRCLAVPAEDGQVVLYSATQSTTEVQEAAARVLGLRSKDITVDVPRLGGAFGGKERTATLWACLAALAAHRTGRPVELALKRVEDAAWTGKRHPYRAHYRVGFGDDGRILAWDVELNANGGAAVDLSMAILERSMLHADNAYYLPAVRIVGRACRTNLPPNTAFRGFGAPQGIFVIECALERIARALRLDPLEVRRRNAYAEGQPTPYGQPVGDAHVAELLAQLAASARYAELRAENEAFNAAHVYARRGLGVVPVKFGISFTSAFLNQGSALVWVYADGTISLSHGGVEMGQEVNTKVAQVAARTLGVSLGRIRVETANTKRVANASPTAASTGADINGNAALAAATELRTRLARVAAAMLAPRLGREPDPAALVFAEDGIWDAGAPVERLTFEAVVHQAYLDRVDLGAHGFYRTPGIHFDRVAGRGTPFHYFAQGCGLARVEVDLVSGCARLLKVHIVHETGRPLNLAVDRGQIAGAFVQGFGWCILEEERFDEAGRWLAVSPSTYKIPTIRDVPEDFVIETVERDLVHASVMGSKAIGEPPLIYGEAAWFAVKDAIESLVGYRREATLAHPATPDAVLAAVASLLSRS
jgi:xanthine dehydrogenase molybdopterin binding subunit